MLKVLAVVPVTFDALLVSKLLELSEKECQAIITRLQQTTVVWTEANAVELYKVVSVIRCDVEG